ncbi:MAG: precorrin-6y C5,15-methyltransferase (decarboxylating) subunit CbiE [Trichocoleus desertorum ATA4-8-CV12]|jgi:precorrin-6Y C5,15-methyltransferase (decarboxylating)|nr:precorrin-6y C5,15-methyltransferase (decarboxylating) subunit CbiE [Trichocoleus desertorum ATA4-8-CV12]
MTPVHVVGIGLDGAAGLPAAIQEIVTGATLIVGSDRHLSYFPEHPAAKLKLGDFTSAIATIRQHLATTATPSPQVVVLASGDPLFFGLGRLLLAELPAEQLTFHPHLSSVQLAFSRVKVPWQDARIISAHGRSLDELTQAIQQGAAKIAVLTDNTHSPAAIAHLLQNLDLPQRYQVWVGENLGSADDRVRAWSLEALQQEHFAPLNVVILLRSDSQTEPLDCKTLPLLGLPDAAFLSFSDRPNLMTKREVRTLVLAELALQPKQVIWDIGAGTGSVSVEMARLVPDAHIYAIEKTAIGASLIQKNRDRFQLQNITAIHAAAPIALQTLPNPDRIFIGGSGGNLHSILDTCATRLTAGGVLVLALATLEHLTQALTWLEQQNALLLQSQTWQHRLLQVQLSRSVPVGPLTRFAPLNPVTLLTISQQSPLDIS